MEMKDVVMKKLYNQNFILGLGGKRSIESEDSQGNSIPCKLCNKAY